MRRIYVVMGKRESELFRWTAIAFAKQSGPKDIGTYT